MKRAWSWCKTNEKELALAVLGFISGLHFGRVMGRHEQ